MKTTNDIHNHEETLNVMVNRIKESPDLSDVNKNLIIDYHNDCFSEGLSTPRVIKYVSELNKLTQWLNKDLDKVSEKDLRTLIAKIERSDYSDYTKRDYKIAIRKFYKWLRKSEEYPEEVKWIKTGVKNHNRKLPEQLLTQEEIQKMIETTDHPRDKAMVSTLYESGVRIGELFSLKLKHVTFDKYGAVLIVNGKTGMRRVRVISSTPYLSTWINNHPTKKKDDLLWVSIGTKKKGEPISYRAISKVLERIGKKAEIEKKVNPHMFRHSRATHLAKTLTEAQMNQYFGWVQGSDMPATYIHMSGRDVDKKILEEAGLKEEKKEESALKPKVCVRCDEINARTSTFCNKCGYPLDVETVMKIEEENKLGDTIMDRGISQPEVKEEIRELIREMIREEIHSALK